MATPPVAGLTPEGYAAPPQDEIRAWLSASWKETFGANSTTAASTLNGKLIDFATLIAVKFYEGGAGAANAAWFPAAGGVALEKLLALFAFPRIPASSSLVNLVVYGEPLTLVGAGSLVSATTTKTRFITSAGAVLDTAKAYVIRIKNTVQGATYRAELDGLVYDYEALLTDSVTDIAEGLRDLIVLGGELVTAVVPGLDPDGNALLVIEDAGLGEFELFVTEIDGSSLDVYDARRVDALAELSGPREAQAGTVIDIQTPINGWVGVTNTADADLGANAESDAAYRQRHRDQLNKGSASVQAIRSAVLALDGVTYCAVRENVTVDVDSEGLPKNAIRVTVRGGDDQEIAETIFKTKAGGIQTWGNEFELVLNGEGELAPVYFQRPVNKHIWVKMVLTKGEKFVDIGDAGAAIAIALALWGDLNIGIGDDVERYAFGTPINVIPGIKGAVITMNETPLASDPEPAYLDADIVCGSTDLALFDTSRITVEFAP